MAVTLSVGLQKKIGMPDFGSLGASVHIECEIDRTLIEHDPSGFHEKVRGVFAACQKSVEDQLANQSSQAGRSNDHGSNGHHANGHVNGNGNGRVNGHRSNVRPATASQARALRAIAGRQRIDLNHLLGDRFNVSRPEELSITAASALIDELKVPAESNGGH
jgi:hypothetical protein